MKFPIKVIYVAGPISGTPEQRKERVKQAYNAAVELWKLGVAPLVPHLNTSPNMQDEGVTAESIYLGDLAFLERCDGMLRLSGWEKSVGVNYEVAWASYHSIPIFDSIDDIKGWLDAGS